LIHLGAIVKKSLFIFIIIFIMLALLLFFLTKPAQGNDDLQVVTVKSKAAKIYASPKQSSGVLTTLSKGEKYPLLQTSKIAAPEYHFVLPGETLWKIADHYGVTVNEIQKRNGHLGSRLFIGQKLAVPQQTTEHTVAGYDTLWKMARQYHISMNEIIKLNKLDAIVLETGKRIKIPDYYYKIQLLGGEKGWIKYSQVSTDRHPRFNLGWNYNGTREDYQKQLKLSELDVVSPRWYTLSNTDALVSISVDQHYATAAKKAGKQVWPLFGNKFDPVLTDKILSKQPNRQKVINLLKNSLVSNRIDGINVDFENIDPKNKQDYVVFIQELKSALQPYGIVVSVDVSRENADPFWSGSLDRGGLGEAADYVIMMGYDEHWATSPKAGSVASIPWTREGVELLMKEVPSHKIILGVPFYTREWITEPSGKVRSIDRTLIETERLIQEKGLKKTWDSTTLQNYVSFTENGEVHQIWIEDEKSMELRYGLVKEFHLRGTAAWYVGGGPADIWNLLK
jgi:spore germination protein